MAGPSLAWVTACSVRGADPDEDTATAALSAAGFAVDVVAWDDADVDWARYDRTVLRSTWDYDDRLAEFVAWLERVDAVSVLHNPLPMVRWSLDKHYLAELGAAGVDVVPTTIVEPGEALRPPAGPFVVKPSIGAGSRGVRVHHHPDGAAAHVADLHAAGAAAQRAVADAALAYVTGRFGVPTYARVDLVTDQDGRPRVLEVELVEPWLFLDEGGDAAIGCLVAALTRT